jgi:DNA polymerase (family 10)
MDNKVIADIFDEIGGLLEIKGESPFRVSAYYRAADVIRNLAEDLSKIYERDELTEVPRIGASIAEKIAEILTDGRCKYLEELRAEIPTSLRAMLVIPGVGPKTAKLIFDVLEIASIDDLKKAAEQGKLRDIKHLGKKTEENILRGISQLEKRSGRMRLDEAFSVAEPIVQALRANPSVLACEPAGSLRRMKETIGDVDILVSSSNPSEVMEHFTSLPTVEYVVAKGETKSSVLTTAGLMVDIRVMEPSQWGAALQYFTGSKEHNVHLRGIARDRKLKINEYGVFDKNGKKIAGGSEEDIYRVLDMELIPPCLREDRGEIEAAQAGKLPSVIRLKDIKGDLHTHSKYSDGLTSIEDMAMAAMILGYEYMAMTDHAEKLYIAGGLTAQDIKNRQKEIGKLNEKFAGKFRILSGLEVNIDNDGNVDYPDEVLERLDIIVASIHSGFGQSKEQLTNRMIKAMENKEVQIIGHPTGRLIGKREPYEIDFEKVFKTAAKTGTRMEVNAFPDRLDLNDEHLKWAKEFGVKFTINTDSHSPWHLKYMKYGVATAQRGWVEADEVLNTLTAEELIKKLK